MLAKREERKQRLAVEVSIPSFDSRDGGRHAKQPLRGQDGGTRSEPEHAGGQPRAQRLERRRYQRRLIPLHVSGGICNSQTDAHITAPHQPAGFLKMATAPIQPPTNPGRRPVVINAQRTLIAGCLATRVLGNQPRATGAREQMSPTTRAHRRAVQRYEDVTRRT
jgi:hypothetical protein